MDDTTRSIIRNVKGPGTDRPRPPYRDDEKLTSDSARKRHSLLARVGARSQEAEIENPNGAGRAVVMSDDTGTGNGPGAARSYAFQGNFLHGRGMAVSIFSF